MSLLGWRGVAPALLLLRAVMLPSVALAQAGYYVTPSFSLGAVYDDNVFSTSSHPKADFISRFTPGIQAGYQSAPLTLLGRYTFDAEIYADHPELDNAQVRQQPSIEFRYLPTRPLTLSVNGSYFETQTPRELNGLTGLEVGRRRAQSFSFAPSIAYQFDALTSGKGGYTFTRDELAGGVSTG